MNAHYSFRKKGNENQFKHQSRVLTKLTKARDHLESSSIALESTKASINEGMKLVKNRQKLIKLADSSELGWKVVKSTNRILSPKTPLMKRKFIELRCEPRERRRNRIRQGAPGNPIDSRHILRNQRRHAWRQTKRNSPTGRVDASIVEPEDTGTEIVHKGGE